MKSSTLPLTSPCSGTKRKTAVPLFFASTGGLRLLSFISILHLSLPLIFLYSPSLRRARQCLRTKFPPLSCLYCVCLFYLLFSQSFTSTEKKKVWFKFRKINRCRTVYFSCSTTVWVYSNGVPGFLFWQWNVQNTEKGITDELVFFFLLKNYKAC